MNVKKEMSTLDDSYQKLTLEIGGSDYGISVLDDLDLGGSSIKYTASIPELFRGIMDSITEIGKNERQPQKGCLSLYKRSLIHQLRITYL